MQVGKQEIHTKYNKHTISSSPLDAFSFHLDSKIYNQDKKYYSSSNSPFYIKMIKYI
jgi:hypothetical protein